MSETEVASRATATDTTAKWREAPSGDKILGYLTAASAAAASVAGVAFLKPLVDLAPFLAVGGLIISGLLVASRSKVIRNHPERHFYDTAWQFLTMASLVCGFLAIANITVVPAEKRLGGVAGLVPGVGQIQASVLPLSKSTKNSLDLVSEISDMDAGTRLKTVNDALSSGDADRSSAALAIIATSRYPELRILGLEQALKEKFGAYIEVDEAKDAPGNALTQAMRGAAVRVNAVSPRGDNFIGTMGAYDAHGSLRPPANFSIGTFVDIGGVGTKVPLSIDASMDDAGELIGIARAATLTTPVVISMPRV